MRKTWLLVALIATFTKTMFAANATSTEVNSYVTQYSQIAIYESVRSGIPASIILGQGILESQFGTGRLAKIANNHFGIKWTSSKDGEYVLLKDDDRDASGNLVQSRFIKYKSTEESYVHHTDFLMNRPNYKRLFAFDRTDYRNWAQGLSDCHYATDPAYASKLINIIETYNLQQYDTPSVLALEEADFKKADDAIATTDYHTSTSYESNQRVSHATQDGVLFEITNTSNATSTTKAAPTKLKTQNSENKKSNNQLFEVFTDDYTPQGASNKPTVTAKKPKPQGRSGN
jgi:Mannosyl-glycoprotein endo-beta-N-acetylglucosaminidase